MHFNLPIRWLALGLMLLTVLNLRGLAASPAQASPLTQVRTPTPMAPVCGPNETWTPGGCQPIRRECPAGTIDVNGNGNDDGDCQRLDPITRPMSCWTPAGPLPVTGHVECALPFSVGGQPLRLINAVGCLDVRRQPYPRALVGLPVELALRGILPPSQLANIPFGAPGSYRVATSEPWTTEGLYLHERYGAGVADSGGRPAFDTRRLLGGDAFPYPSLNNVRAQLRFRLQPEVSWSTERLPGPFATGLAEPLKLIYPRASFPLPELADLLSPFGPAVNGANTLPAFKLNVQTAWQLVLVAEWDNYVVNGNRQYVRGAHERVEVPLGGPFTSARVWDSRQSAAGVAAVHCNAAAGYVPVPVIEAQSALQP